MEKKEIIEQLQKMPEPARVIWMLEQIEQMEKDFEEASDRISDRCERLISDFFSESLDLPKKIKRLAEIGVRYQNFIDRFKSKIMLDESIVSGEARELLQTAKAEILQLRADITKSEVLSAGYRRDMRIMERQLYAYREIETLKTDKQKSQARKLCEGLSTKYKIDEVLRQVRKDDKK